MPTDDFYTPTDVEALRMENELLAFEVSFLKAKLAEPERFNGQLRSRLAAANRSAAKYERLAEQRLAKAERAEQDLILLLKRLSNSPLGGILRLRDGFRTLEQRYLDTHD